MTAPGGPTDIRAHAAGSHVMIYVEQHVGKQIDVMGINANISNANISKMKIKIFG